MGDENQRALKEGREAAEDLAEALALAGVQLPSLVGTWPVLGSPLVHLGGCTARTARELAEWIREHA